MIVCRDPAREIGLVFSGGGLKGGYEIGVWKALNEKGITPRITAVSGTSIGALNGMLFACGDYPAAEALWLAVRQSDLMCLPTESAPDAAAPAEAEAAAQHTRQAQHSLRKKLTEFGAEKLMDLLNSREGLGDKLGAALGENWQSLLDAGVFSQQRLAELIRSVATPEKARGLAVQLAVTCTRIKKMSYLLDRDEGCEPITFDVGERPADYEKLLMASAAIPAVYPPVVIDGERYVDGGVTDGSNTPVRPLYAAGYRKMIVVYLKKTPEARIRKGDYPGAVFAELVPGEGLDTGPLAAIHMPEEGIASELAAGYGDAMATCLFGD